MTVSFLRDRGGICGLGHGILIAQIVRESISIIFYRQVPTMGVLNASDLKPGMVLEDDVVTNKGTKLLPKGIELTERHIEIMNTWNVTEAPVVGLSKGDITRERLNSVSDEDRAKIKAGVEMLFSGFEGDEVMDEIARVVTKVKITRLAESGPSSGSEE